MMKFSALNESSLSDDNGDPELASREAQEEEAYSLYHIALKKQSEGELEESEKLLKEILEMEFLEQALSNEDDEEEVEAPLRPILTLKYLLYKNLANISNERKDYKSAVAYFLEALEIDPSDVMMWYQMGKASLNISNYSLARLSFEEGLKCNPQHWPCLDNVITVMHALNDYANCLYYIAKALERECYYLKGLAFKDEIYREDPSLKSFCGGYFNKCDSSIHYADYDKEEAQKLIQESLDMREKKQSFYKPVPLPILTLSQPIKENTWKCLGESLINMYECIKHANPSVSYNCKVDLAPYMNNPNQTSEEKTATPSPISSLSETCSSNSVPLALQNGQKNGGLLQLATVPQNLQNNKNPVIEPTQTDMEVEEVAPPMAPVPYSLVLAPVEVQPTDLSICTDSTSSNKRTSKRKRLDAELIELSAKRRSSRVRNPAVKKPQDNINYQELLQKFLPPKLIGDGKCDDPDVDSEPVSLDKTSGDVSCGQSSENDKSDKSSTNSGDLSFSEKEDVIQFISSNQANSGIVDLLYKYAVCLGEKSSCVWPKNLIDVFCEAFCRLRNHITTPNMFSQSSEPERLKEMGLAILCYCEFKVDKWYLSTGHSMSFSPKSSGNSSSFQNGQGSIGNDFHSDMEFLVMLTVRRDVLEGDWLNYSARALWLKAKFHSLEGEIDLAVCCMGKLSDILSEENEVKITVLNSNFSDLITADNVQQQLESLQRCQSLEEVQRLYEHADYSAVVNLLILTFNQPPTKRKQSLEGVPERHAQLLLLQNSLMKLERYKDCVFWTEMSFNEALQQFMNAARPDWSETMAHLLSGLNDCVKMNPKYLSELEESKLVRLTQNLILVIVIQMESYDFSCDNASMLIVLPWMILYRLILNEEKRSKSKKVTKVSVIEMASSSNKTNFLTDFDLSCSMPSSLMLLFTAHEYLGRRSWCTFADGYLLLYCLDVMMAELQDTKGDSYLYREDLETGLEQCIYCLYGHPNKRTRAKHLQEHNSKQIPLTLERAKLIFQYFKPNVLPEFDSYRTSTVSAELESLLKRIALIVPPDEDPTTRVDNYTAYIEGVTDKCPEPPFKDKTPSAIVKDLYYLLGDYYFKNKEFSKAIRFYLMDICINPDRQDSWAGMALSRSSQLDQKLNSYELRNESTIYRKSSAALKCFEHALELDPTTTSLWIEHGSLAYILHSHASRQLKQDSVCEELHELLKKKKLEMLQVAEKCFLAANHCEDGGEPEEAWLHHYMLGKICEKKGERPTVYLDHFQKALMYLHEDFARYPQKIQYHNPLELAIEALEVYYRVHASCLKCLWKHEDKGMDIATLKVMRQCLKAISMSPFATFQEKCKKEVSCSSSPVSELEDSMVIAMPTVTDPQPNPDHNYIEKNPQKIAENLEKRISRPSIDSSPETQENMAIKEVVESLVSVIAERFVDEELEKSSKKTKMASSKNNHTKLVIESIGEQSIYTSSTISKESEKMPGEVVLENMLENDGVPNKEEKDDYTKLQELALEKETEAAASLLVEELALEKETEAAASFLVEELALEKETEAAASLLMEEMRMESNALGDMDYCDYDMYSGLPKQEEQDLDSYDGMVIAEDEFNDQDIGQQKIMEDKPDEQHNSDDPQTVSAAQPNCLQEASGDQLNDPQTVSGDQFNGLHTVSDQPSNPEKVSGGQPSDPQKISAAQHIGQQTVTEGNSISKDNGQDHRKEKNDAKNITEDNRKQQDQNADDIPLLLTDLLVKVENSDNIKEDNKLVVDAKNNSDGKSVSEPALIEKKTEDLHVDDEKLSEDSVGVLEIDENWDAAMEVESSNQGKTEIQESSPSGSGESMLKQDTSKNLASNLKTDEGKDNSTAESKEVSRLEDKRNEKEEVVVIKDAGNKESSRIPTNTADKGNKLESKSATNVIEVVDLCSNSENPKLVNKEKHSKKANSKSSKRTSVKAVVPPTPEELKKSLVEIDNLIPLCLDSLRGCLQRFIQHYKSLYRMAHYYCHSKKNKNLQWAREILLAATPPTRHFPSMPGLFAERKNTNFFNGIWRAPSNEIDRPGSFGAHMYRSIALLIEVLIQQKDYNMLLYLTQQLYRTPDLGKKYMRDTDRVYLVRNAYDACVNILREQMNSLLQEEPPPEESRLICCLLEIYRSCQTLLKSGIYVDETNDLLEEAYTMYRIGEVDSHPSVLEQATKFCQVQLGKSYPQNIYEPNKPGAKFLGMSDPTEINTNPSISAVSAYSSDPWGKEFTKPIMMSMHPGKPRPTPELEVIQDPVILIPLDSNRLVSHLGPSIGSKPCTVVASQMIHVEKPKAENMQACSVAFLPVTPVFTKDVAVSSNPIPGTSLLSCQAYECFDVLTSIMQASGYKVAKQQDTVAPMNLVKPKTDVFDFNNEPPSPKISKPRRRKRKASCQKIVALNLCKRSNKPKPIASCNIANSIPERISTTPKPIVSSTIANSIAELKVGNLSSPKSNTKEATKCTVKSSPKNESMCLTPVVKAPTKEIPLPKDDTLPIHPEIKIEVAPSKKPEDAASDMPPCAIEYAPESFVCNDMDEDSSTSTNIDACLIEQCAKEMLEFINQKVEDMVLQSKRPLDCMSMKMAKIESVVEKIKDKNLSMHLNANNSSLNCVNKSEEENLSLISKEAHLEKSEDMVEENELSDRLELEEATNNLDVVVSLDKVVESVTVNDGNMPTSADVNNEGKEKQAVSDDKKMIVINTASNDSQSATNNGECSKENARNFNIVIRKSVQDGNEVYTVGNSSIQDKESSAKSLVSHSEIEEVKECDHNIEDELVDDRNDNATVNEEPKDTPVVESSSTIVDGTSENENKGTEKETADEYDVSVDDSNVENKIFESELVLGFSDPELDKMECELKSKEFLIENVIVNDDDSDTLDADMKEFMDDEAKDGCEESKEDPSKPGTLGGKNVICSVVESSELSKGSSTESAACSPECEQEEQKDLQTK